MLKLYFYRLYNNFSINYFQDKADILEFYKYTYSLIISLNFNNIICLIIWPIQALFLMWPKIVDYLCLPIITFFEMISYNKYKKAIDIFFLISSAISTLFGLIPLFQWISQYIKNIKHNALYWISPWYHNIIVRIQAFTDKQHSTKLLLIYKDTTLKQMLKLMLKLKFKSLYYNKYIIAYWGIIWDFLFYRFSEIMNIIIWYILLFRLSLLRLSILNKWIINLANLNVYFLRQYLNRAYRSHILYIIIKIQLIRIWWHKL